MHATHLCRLLRLRRRALPVVLLFLLALPAPPARAAEALAPLSEVVDELKQGGLVIYFRHAATDKSQSDAAADIERCETQRNLSEEGRAQAESIGKAVKALGIPVGKVFSSPFCRCVDTAKLAFGRAEVDDDLFFAVGASKDDVARMTKTLRGMLSAKPDEGTNTVIVSHTANLREAAGIWPKPEGVAIVFRPLGDDRFEAVAKADSDEWSRTAGM